jgi:hypothetical protein
MGGVKPSGGYRGTYRQVARCQATVYSLFAAFGASAQCTVPGGLVNECNGDFALVIAIMKNPGVIARSLTWHVSIATSEKYVAVYERRGRGIVKRIQFGS